jgi:23S rRNA (adenine2503-C2)-methyltransferase
MRGSMVDKINILEFPRRDLLQEVLSIDQSEEVANNLWNLVYIDNKFDQQLTSEFKDFFYIPTLSTVNIRDYADGSIRFTFASEGEQIESCYTNAEGGTLYISSQLGKNLISTYCHVDEQRFIRNLRTSEMVLQLFSCNKYLKQFNKTVKRIRFTSLGEPLLNYTSVANFIRIITDERGLGYSRRDITISTSGVVPGIMKCGSELGVKLDIALHAVNNSIRDRIVPMNRKYPIEALIDACKAYPAGKGVRPINLEYLLLQDLNDSIYDANALVKITRGTPVNIKLITKNPWKGIVYSASSRENVDKFIEVLSRHGVHYSLSLQPSSLDDIKVGKKKELLS